MSVSSSGISFPDGSASAVVVAGGAGARMESAAGGVRKQYLEVSGRPILQWALRPFLDHPAVGEVVVVVPAVDLKAPPSWLLELPVKLVAGGGERSDSVWNGLQAVSPASEVVLVHDGARPFVSRELIDRVLEHAYAGGTVPAIRATDTIKEADDAGFVRRTADRTRLWHAQTPQGFPRALLLDAYRRARREGWSSTDDASVVEQAGSPVRLVTGATENLKITRPTDLELAELVARRLRGSG
jgi:2-C-methyl-D-erythritol 4-phosphate cytidylyltransferase